ncbi:hypothetical protein TNCV_3975091 [Trichonephila clavipes]|nr:hypothetical protein TNCV_3975091 [Trichonephila clavipes]
MNISLNDGLDKLRTTSQSPNGHPEVLIQQLVIYSCGGTSLALREQKNSGHFIQEVQPLTPIVLFTGNSFDIPILPQ